MVKHSEKKIKSKTLSVYKRWNAGKWALYAGTYIFPVVPATVMVGINWDNWIAKAGNSGWSLGLGFGSLLLALLITIVGVAKKDVVLKKNVSPLYYFGLILVIWAIALMFLANILENFGVMLLYVSFGLLGGATCDQVNKSKVSEETAFYKKLVEDNLLDIKRQKKSAKKEAVRQQAEAEKLSREAIE